MPYPNGVSLQPSPNRPPVIGGVATPIVLARPAGEAAAAAPTGAAAAAAALPGPAAAQARAAQRNPQPDTTLQGAGQSGAKGFFSAIGTWFKDHFTRTDPLLPDTVTLQGKRGPATLNGTQFKSMIKALHADERAAAANSLAATLQPRVAAGRTALMRAQNFQPGDVPATEQEVSDLVLYLKVCAAEKNSNYDEGSLNLPDPNGSILRFLKSCEGSYARSSSHLTGLQGELLPDGDVNVQRSIDIAPGPTTGLISHHRTVLFGAITSLDGQGPQRLFLKTETHGCRLSTLDDRLAAVARQGTGGTDRPVRPGDKSEFFFHALSFITSRFQRNLAGARKEHLPSTVSKEYKKALEDLEKLGPEGKAIAVKLASSRATEGGYGLRSLQAKLTELDRKTNGFTKDLRGRDMPALTAVFAKIQTAIAGLEHKDSIDERLGNEVVLQQVDL